ncbi:ABC transporter ATP-binding protein [Spirosoma fluviale]|uniref:ABC-type multidrug transport system, ATPase component n=1 Tax=Spirosoma fluviale TaxID=1597977 RepID=A0A286FHC3_9BACT|nr:ABC transporter ATP-binding protein [Spirosoma fluviale]SOD82620.1 ABC-type multidrug transport system, ATPase component [Spirosoma fluviale]
MNLVIENLTKTYSNGVRALNGISLTIEPGLFGLLGPNGAGKSSLMRTIATLQLPDSGRVVLQDADGQSIDAVTQPDELRKVLGYLPQDFGVYPRIDALTLLDHLAVLKGIHNRAERKESVEALLHRVNLWDVRKKNLSSYSGGMRQRFGIAQALLGNPKLIIVDEPTAGLDPAESNRFLNLLANLGQDAIVILSTHIVQDVQELCRQMAIINKGELLLSGHPLEAVRQLEGKIWKKHVQAAEVESLHQDFVIINERMVAGDPVLYAYAEAMPASGFIPVDAGLEEVYFTEITGASERAKKQPALSSPTL